MQRLQRQRIALVHLGVAHAVRRPVDGGLEPGDGAFIFAEIVVIPAERLGAVDRALLGGERYKIGEPLALNALWRIVARQLLHHDERVEL